MRHIALLLIFLCALAHAEAGRDISTVGGGSGSSAPIVTGPMTYTVGTDYPTLQATINYLATANIDCHAGQVTVNVPANHSSETVTMRGLDLSCVDIVGTTAKASMTSVQSTSGSTSAYSYVVNVGSVTGISVNDIAATAGMSGGTHPENMIGAFLISAVDAVNNRLTLKSGFWGANVPSGNVHGTLIIFKSTFTGNWTEYGSNLHSIQGIALNDASFSSLEGSSEGDYVPNKSSMAVWEDTLSAPLSAILVSSFSSATFANFYYGSYNNDALLAAQVVNQSNLDINNFYQEGGGSMTFVSNNSNFFNTAGNVEGMITDAGSGSSLFGGGAMNCTGGSYCLVSTAFDQISGTQHPLFGVAQGGQMNVLNLPTNSTVLANFQPYDCLNSDGSLLQNQGSTGSCSGGPNSPAGNSGQVNLSGSSSGTTTVQVPAAAGTYLFTLPATAGTVGQPALSDGGAGTGITWGAGVKINPNSMTLTSFTFSNIGTVLTTNGQIGYCSDCTIANPCAGSGTGAIAKRLNGVNVCN